MDWKATLLPTLVQGSSVLVPLLWAQLGPIAVRAITSIVNKVSTQYVPREWQVILSAVLGAVISGLSGDDVPVMAVAAGSGVVSQLYTMANPKTWRTSEP